jgi:hypothetical protein
VRGDWKLQDDVRTVLNESWDPIGVADQSPDEYDGYIAGLHGLLQREGDDARSWSICVESRSCRWACRDSQTSVSLK